MLLFPNLAVCLPASAREVARMRREGAGGTASREFGGSPLATWLRRHPLEGRLHSNRPEFVLLYANRGAFLIPARREKLEALLELQSRPATWVWSNLIEEERGLIAEVRAKERGVVLAELPDGVVIAFP